MYSLLAALPPLEGRGHYTHEQFTWLGEAKAVMHDWDESESTLFNKAVEQLIRNNDRGANYGIVISSVHSAIERIENSLPKNQGQAFDSGAGYDFFVALNNLVASANTQIIIVDPYLDAQVFEGYLHALKPGVSVRLIASNYVNNVRVAAEKFRAQNGTAIELRHSGGLHDRVIFVDDNQCWVLGSSIKDAALKKPTYLVPLSFDVIAEKRRIYEAIWASGTSI